ncbi:MAG: TIGR02281 family clan AA aspartic protease [Hoeflea sp.]|uniref:TIGR02281 family clan AA aspartic protease n=1 Tax=Hoeflea sp. TaxID=1940281 RepID=UPI001DF74BC3|nr:TIGR02281 family clan AA aspartic protease [Hoeflea sp.]MBU4531651.1 TIGR02281 family clan AA aspartic protease [Alphaproteobacteria bacterium]MBU4544508.1 TIGR02281 family clan AA aspartic protease [Alphaproteobacteria bacterium]MBU4552739.1 TIGR02281 family clan AA aspartic protease [Alphaproteobacteria bacterium]MBV1724927.1 TIGR02281 family clan AA aspartic protease [Hoeflea sp.]MBV1760947.1 TIGR02281 family clan AA aspartic protease [Hoeflea sp.]
MFKNLFIISCAVLAISGLPYYFQDNSAFQSENVGLEAATEKPVAALAEPVPARPTAHYATGVRTASIPLSNDGHFTTDFRINGRYVRGLIDTGATYVAINRTTARNLGLGVSNSDFKHQVRTANGLAKAALVTIDRIEVGSVSVGGVEAFVLDDAALSATLIGMSFMSKLQSYRVTNNKLELVN